MWYTRETMKTMVFFRLSIDLFKNFSAAAFAAAVLVLNEAEEDVLFITKKARSLHLNTLNGE